MKLAFLRHVLTRTRCVFHLTSRRLRRGDIRYTYEAKLGRLGPSKVRPESVTLKINLIFNSKSLTLNIDSSGTRGLLSGFGTALNVFMTDNHANLLTYGLGGFNLPSTLP